VDDWAASHFFVFITIMVFFYKKKIVGDVKSCVLERSQAASLVGQKDSTRSRVIIIIN
jgi:hypothetical protein